MIPSPSSTQPTIRSRPRSTSNGSCECVCQPKNYKGANPNNLTLSPDESTLYVTNGGENAVAVVHLSRFLNNSRVTGLIPTGWYPNSVSVSRDGGTLYIVNGKSAAGPNPQEETGSANQYIWQLTKAGFQTVPAPDEEELERLTSRVLENDHFFPDLRPEQQETMAELHRKVHHVIYIIKENRTYDQILGDLEVGNGDPSLTMFGDADTPNLHKIARNFVDFDNFYDTSDVSGRRLAVVHIGPHDGRNRKGNSGELWCSRRSLE